MSGPIIEGTLWLDLTVRRTGAFVDPGELDRIRRTAGDIVHAPPGSRVTVLVNDPYPDPDVVRHLMEYGIHVGTIDIQGRSAVTVGRWVQALRAAAR